MNAVPEEDVVGQVEEGGEEVATEQFEKDARGMGWRPEDEWDGPPGKWIDAKTFIERGEQIMPILRANNRKMKEELLTRDKDVSTLKESLATAQKAITALRKGYSEATKREVEVAIADLKERFKQAREVGDVDLELQVKDNIDSLTAKVKQIGKDAEEEAPPDDKGKGDGAATLSPEFIEWQEKNKWFGNTINQDDKVRTETLIKIGEKLRKDGTELVGLPFMDKCMEILKEREEGYSRPKGKVESGGRPSGGSGGRAWDSLPKEAKAICHEDNAQFVGPGKMFKTVKEWEDHYASLYGEG
jgi:hypothetical protein